MDGSPLLTREQLHTAVARARGSVTLFGTQSALRSAIGRRAQRSSGLGARLWGRDGGRRRAVAGGGTLVLA